MAARVLIVDAKPHRSQELERALREAGFEVLMAVDGRDDLYARVRDLAPDAIIVDTDLPSRDTLEGLAYVGKKYPKPMIMLAHDTDPSLTVAAARAGVTAYAVEELSPATLRSLVDVAIAHFSAHEALRSELAKARNTLESRKLVDRAKCQLMERKGIGEEAAYQYLRKAAMDRRISLTDLARELLDTNHGE